MMTSLFLPDMLQTDKDLYFLRLNDLSQWNLASGDIFCCLLVILHQKGKKTCHESSNDDVINLKATTERYTFSSIL